MNSEQALTALANGIRETGTPSCQQSDPEAWFPEGAHRLPEKRQAIILCKACPVQALCLEFALVNNEQYGIWGGLGSGQRARIRSARNKEAKEAAG